MPGNKRTGSFQERVGNSMSQQRNALRKLEVARWTELGRRHEGQIEVLLAAERKLREERKEFEEEKKETEKKREKMDAREERQNEREKIQNEISKRQKIGEERLTKIAKDCDQRVLIIQTKENEMGARKKRAEEDQRRVVFRE